MRKLATVVAIMIIVVGILIIIINRPFGSGKPVFYIENPDEVNRVIISSEDGKVKITKGDDGWFIDEGMKARNGAIEFLLKTLEDMRIKSPVSDNLFNELTADETTEHIEVEVYGKRRLIQAFKVYRNNNPEYPDIMQKKEKTEPYFMYIPGYDTDPADHFIADKKFWLPFTIFRLNAGQIATISMDYYNQPDSSFKIIRTGEGISFLSKEYHDSSIDSLALGRYLSYFTYVPFEDYEYNVSTEIKDSITESTPYFNLKLVTIDSDTIDLYTWKRILKNGNSILADTDRMWGSLNGGEDLIIIKYYDIDPLIKEPAYFISN